MNTVGPNKTPSLSREEAVLLCQVALRAGTPASERALIIDVGRDTTQLILAAGEQPIAIWNLNLGAGSPAQAIAGALGGARIGFLRGSIRRGIAVARFAGSARGRARILDAIAEALHISEVNVAPRYI